MAFALLAITILYTWSLNRSGIITPDEPRYAAIAKHMADSGDWISPILWEEPWFEKPALPYWLMAVGFKIGLPGEYAPRLPIALVSVAFLWFFYAALTKLLDSEETAIHATLILATTAYWFAFSQVAVTDLPLAATFTACALCALLGKRWWAGVMLGLALLAKGLVAGALLLPLIWILRRDWKQWILPGLLGFAVAAVWYVPVTIRYGKPFIDVFFIQHHFGRFLNTALEHGQPFWFYIPVLLGAIFPWTPLLFSRDLFRGERARSFMLIVLWGLLFFSLSKNKLPGYLLPLVPSVAVLLALRLEHAKYKNWLMGLCAMLLVFLPMAAEVVPKAIDAGLRKSMSGSISPFWGMAAMVLLLARPGIRNVAILTVVCLGWLQWRMSPEVDKLASARPLWKQMESKPKAAQCVGRVSRSIRYGLNYYANRTLPDCE